MLQSQEDAEDECDLDEDEELDPRVQDELERLNSCTDEINQVEQCPQSFISFSPGTYLQVILSALANSY